MFPFGFGYDDYGYRRRRHGYGHEYGYRRGGIINNLIVNIRDERDEYRYDHSGCFVPLP